MEQITAKVLTTARPDEMRERGLQTWERTPRKGHQRGVGAVSTACGQPETAWQGINTPNALSSHPPDLLSMPFLNLTQQDNMWVNFLEPRAGRQEDLERQKEDG